MGLLIRIVVTAAALWVASLVVPGIHLTESGTSGTIVTAVLVAILFGVLNTLVKPLLILLGIPLIAVTLGLFLLVINALMLMLTGWLAGVLGMPFAVDGFGAAFVGAIIVSLVAWLLNTLVPDKKH